MAAPMKKTACGEESGGLWMIVRYLQVNEKVQPVTGGMKAFLGNYGLEFCAAVFIFIVITSYTTSYYFTLRPLYEHIRVECTAGDVAAKVSGIIPKYSRNHSVFLKLRDYFWTKNISLYSLPYGTNKNDELIMQALALTNHYDLTPDIDRLACRRCVVVGNGYRMKNSSLGETIDKYDIVIRLNNAPVNNYEKDVGSKTTLRLFYPESADFNLILDNDPETLMVLVPFKSADLKWLITILNDEKRFLKGFWKSPPLIWDVRPENIRILNPYFMMFTATELLDNKNPKKIWTIPTTGMMAITFAIHFCDLVHIAGYGYPSPSHETQPIHYYDKRTLNFMKNTGHKTPVEAIAIKKLLEHNVIHNLTYF